MHLSQKRFERERKETKIWVPCIVSDHNSKFPKNFTKSGTCKNLGVTDILIIKIKFALISETVRDREKRTEIWDQNFYLSWALFFIIDDMALNVPRALVFIIDDLCLQV